MKADSACNKLPRNTPPAAYKEDSLQGKVVWGSKGCFLLARGGAHNPSMQPIPCTAGQMLTVSTLPCSPKSDTCGRPLRQEAGQKGSGPTPFSTRLPPAVAGETAG